MRYACMHGRHIEGAVVGLRFNVADKSFFFIRACTRLLNFHSPFTSDNSTKDIYWYIYNAYKIHFSTSVLCAGRMLGYTQPMYMHAARAARNNNSIHRINHLFFFPYCLLAFLFFFFFPKFWTLFLVFHGKITHHACDYQRAISVFIQWALFCRYRIVVRNLCLLISVIFYYQNDRKAVAKAKDNLAACINLAVDILFMLSDRKLSDSHIVLSFFFVGSVSATWKKNNNFAGISQHFRN